MISNVVFFESELKSNSEPKCLEIFTNKSLYLLTGQKIDFRFHLFCWEFVKTISFHYSRNKANNSQKKKAKKSKKGNKQQERGMRGERNKENANEHLTVVFIF
jgi:hypothetical protein